MSEEVIKARTLNVTRMTAGTTGVALILAMIDAIFGEGSVMPQFTNTQWSALMIAGLVVTGVVVAADTAVRAYVTAHLAPAGPIPLPMPINGRLSQDRADPDVTVVAVARGSRSGAMYLIANSGTVEWVDADNVEFP